MKGGEDLAKCLRDLLRVVKMGVVVGEMLDKSSREPGMVGS